MTGSKHKLTQTSTVAKSFSDGARAGEQFGLSVAPYVVMAMLIIGGWVAYRIARFFLRVTH